MKKRKQHPSGISISKLQCPVQVRSKPLKATLSIRPILMGDLEYLEDLAHEDLSDREFVARVLHHQVSTPVLDIQNIFALSDRSLLHIASYWGNSELASQDDQPVKINSFQEFRKAAYTFLANWSQHTEQLAGAMQNSLKRIALPPIPESILKSTQWMDSIVRYQSQFDMLTRPAIEQLKLYDSMLKTLPADMGRI